MYESYYLGERCESYASQCSITPIAILYHYLEAYISLFTCLFVFICYLSGNNKITDLMLSINVVFSVTIIIFVLIEKLYKSSIVKRITIQHNIW